MSQVYLYLNVAAVPDNSPFEEIGLEVEFLRGSFKYIITIIS